MRMEKNYGSPLMIRYIEESPYGKEYSLHGMEGLLFLFY